ncbi:MAG: class I SAM-dependent methyltransferase [Bacteroidales bacterium]|jgi:2-polyprenyl-6-hydroxyphenyl methylase/3-demethylubiquinone-9 3-methyltransferase|nr:class I SAM-dependent methyltransferase [Bacteroidales bacterium]
MAGYYDKTLSAQRLKQCYQIAPPRIVQYFNAEIEFVLNHIHRKDIVLDVGCGYGRIIPYLAEKARFVYGIDTSLSSLLLGKEYLKYIPNCMLQQMNAVDMTFSRGSMDVVLCIQNGLSAFHEDQRSLVRESIRVTKPGGTILFSTYSLKIWDSRLEWFKLQSEAGLIGEIDEEKTGNGVIVCKDGFTATTILPDHFRELTKRLHGITVTSEEVDGSCVFYMIRKRSG